jgi:hypothetical protein
VVGIVGDNDSGCGGGCIDVVFPVNFRFRSLSLSPAADNNSRDEEAKYDDDDDLIGMVNAFFLNENENGNGNGSGNGSVKLRCRLWDG